MTPSRIAALALLATIGGGVAAQTLKPEQEARIRPAGAPLSCIPITAIRETRVRDDSTIDFYASAGKVYRVRLPQPCPELGFERRFTYETSLSQLCAADIITVLRQGPLMRGASCGLADFQPIDGAPR